MTKLETKLHEEEEEEEGGASMSSIIKGVCANGHETFIHSERPWFCASAGCEERPVYPGRFVTDDEQATIERAIAASTTALLQRLNDGAARLQAEVASLRQCSTCCGTPHASGLPCICGGTNSREDEVKNLRLESMFLLDAVTRMGDEINALKAEKENK